MKIRILRGRSDEGVAPYRALCIFRRCIGELASVSETEGLTVHNPPLHREGTEASCRTIGLFRRTGFF